MHKGTELDNPLELSVEERMTLSVKGYTKTLVAIGVVTLAILFSALYAAFMIHVSPVLTTEGNTSYVPEVLYFVSIVSGGCFVWVLKTGRKIYKENEIIVREYTHQAYLMALSVYGREGDADLDFYEIARDVFPELKKLDIKSVEKSGKEMEVEELTVKHESYFGKPLSLLEEKWGKKKGEFTFDIVTNTENGKFIIKDFKKMASYDDLKTWLNVVDSQNWEDKLRLVYLAENFDGDILKKYEKLVESTGYPVDLILVNAKGFSALKISDEI